MNDSSIENITVLVLLLCSVSMISEESFISIFLTTVPPVNP